MYLDETILQSRTTLSLVEFIDELIEYKGVKINDELYGKYKEIKRQTKKAKDKRYVRRIN
jgi:hypothetical protein